MIKKYRYISCLDRVLKLAGMMLAGMMLHEMPEDDKQLCIQLLKHIEIKFSSLVQQHKGEAFDIIYKELVGEPSVKGENKKRK